MSQRATLAAFGGEILRDTEVGPTPRASLRHWPYLAVAAAAAVVVCYRHTQGAGLRRPADAAGLASTTVPGARLALDAGLGPATTCSP